MSNKLNVQDFLLAILIDGLGHLLSPVKYRTDLRYRFMISLFPIDEVCPVCRKACLDTFGEHVVYCKEVGISVKKEAPVNFLTDPLDRRSTLRHADVMVYGWLGGKKCVGPFIVGMAVLKVASSKVAKHEKAYSDDQHAFIPFVFYPFSFLAPEAINLLHRVQNVMYGNIMSPKSMNVVFMRIGFAFRKDLVTQYIARLLSIQV
ncbi:transmembrane protein, putative [Medicago truncatula]|uniref:Transmembrane protein, putative n=1 Tax=Medicago truncatula TaxID=3880 RepID=G7KAB9_MEDTR|nr:transmembrane protein, putative [Medicago truncatula]